MTALRQHLVTLAFKNDVISFLHLLTHRKDSWRSLFDQFFLNVLKNANVAQHNKRSFALVCDLREVYCDFYCKGVVPLQSQSSPCWGGSRLSEGGSSNGAGAVRFPFLPLTHELNVVGAGVCDGGPRRGGGRRIERPSSVNIAIRKEGRVVVQQSPERISWTKVNELDFHTSGLALWAVHSIMHRPPHTSAAFVGTPCSYLMHCKYLSVSHGEGPACACCVTPS